MIRAGKHASSLRKVYLSHKFLGMLEGGREGEKKTMRACRVKWAVWDSVGMSRTVPDSCPWGLI